ncbi:hypothetical protein MRB53_039400 [Persea americana]|nr:hypothetical protein MRB53_039400 [Persea americana]
MFSASRAAFYERIILRLPHLPRRLQARLARHNHGYIQGKVRVHSHGLAKLTEGDLIPACPGLTAQDASEVGIETCYCFSDTFSDAVSGAGCRRVGAINEFDDILRRCCTVCQVLLEAPGRGLLHARNVVFVRDDVCLEVKPALLRRFVHQVVCIYRAINVVVAGVQVLDDCLDETWIVVAKMDTVAAFLESLQRSHDASAFSRPTFHCPFRAFSKNLTLVHTTARCTLNSLPPHSMTRHDCRRQCLERLCVAALIVDESVKLNVQATNVKNIQKRSRLRGRELEGEREFVESDRVKDARSTHNPAIIAARGVTSRETDSSNTTVTAVVEDHCRLPLFT